MSVVYRFNKDGTGAIKQWSINRLKGYEGIKHIRGNIFLVTEAQTRSTPAVKKILLIKLPKIDGADTIIELKEIVTTGATARHFITTDKHHIYTIYGTGLGGLAPWGEKMDWKGNVIKTWSLSLIQWGLDTDGRVFYTGDFTNDLLYIYDKQFNLVTSVSINFDFVSGMCFDGRGLWFSGLTRVGPLTVLAYMDLKGNVMSYFVTPQPIIGITTDGKDLYGCR